MAEVYSNQTTSFDNKSTPASGSGNIKLHYDCKSSSAVLTMWGRQIDSSFDFSPINQWSKHFLIDIDVDGVEFAFTWEPDPSDAEGFPANLNWF